MPIIIIAGEDDRIIDIDEQSARLHTAWPSSFLQSYVWPMTAFRSGTNDVGPPNVLLRGAAIRDDRIKSIAVRSGEVHDNSCSHPEELELRRSIWESSE